MSGGALGSAAANAMRRPTVGSVTASTFLLAGTQALGILLSPTGVKRGTFADFSVNPGEASDTVSYIAGTVETVPHLITYFDFASKKVKNDVEVAQMLLNAGLDGLAGYIAGGGTFGITPDPPTAYIGLAEGAVFGAIIAGLGQLRTASYRYYCGFLYGICHGVIDSIEAVKVDERIVSNGATAGDAFLIDDPQAWGGDHVDGGVYALAKAIPGHFWPTQQPDPYLITQLGNNTASWSGKAMFLIYGWSGFTESGYFAATPQGSPVVRPLKLRVKRLPNNLEVPEYHDVGGDANLAECCFESLTSPVFGVKKLPLSKIDVASFQLGAQTHHTRGLGISVEMNSDVDVETALDKFTELGGSIIYGSFNSGTIRYKVIERNYSIPSLPVFRRGPDGSAPEAYNVIRVSGFTPGAWPNTANDFTFDYIDRDNNYLKTTRYMQDTANRMLTGRVRSISQSLDGVSNGTSAALVGTRELRNGAYPRPPISLAVNRDGYEREPGDVIKYIDNVDNLVKILRITDVQKLATDDTAEIQFNCIEDQYAVGAVAYSPFIPPGFTLKHHYNLQLEDNFYSLSGPATVLPGLRDAISVNVSVPLSLSGFNDSINNLADNVALSVRASLAFSDSINNLTDAMSSTLGSGFGGPAFPSITGEWARYEAFRETIYSNGDFAPTATDQSGNGRHWTQSGASNTSPKWLDGELNGLAVYDGDHAANNGWDTGPDMSGLTAVHAFMIVKAKDDPAGDLGRTGLWNVGTDANSEHIPYTNGLLYSDAFRTTRVDALSHTINLASDYRLLEWISTSSEWTLIINGTETVHSTGTNTVGCPMLPTLLIASGALGRHRLCGLHIFSNKLTTDRATLLSYFNNAAIYNKGWS